MEHLTMYYIWLAHLVVATVIFGAILKVLYSEDRLLEVESSEARQPDQRANDGEATVNR